MFFKKKKIKALVNKIVNWDVGTATIRVTFKDGKDLDHKIYGYIDTDGSSEHVSTLVNDFIIFINPFESAIVNDTLNPTYSYLGFIQSKELISINSYVMTKEIEIYE